MKAPTRSKELVAFHKLLILIRKLCIHRFDRFIQSHEYMYRMGKKLYER
jgi:hypothetical protein